MSDSSANISLQKYQVDRPEFRPPLRYGDLELPSRYLLSPLAGYTNLSFRRVIREIGGVGLATTDLVNARALLAGSRKSLQLIDTCPEDSPFAVQIFGNEATSMCEAAQLLEERQVDTIDINMGCPVERIAGNGSGAGMMCNASGTIELVRRIVESVRIPVSVKMRLGWDETQLTAPAFACEFEQVGVCAIAIHGRTRSQGFKGAVDRNGIRQVVEAVSKIPVIGNGDIRGIPDAARMLAETGCHGISVGRGALANPWIFRQLAEWEAVGEYQHGGAFDDRLRLLRRQLFYLTEQLGPHAGIIVFRRTAHWYLKGMKVRAWQRNRFQQARNLTEIDNVLTDIAEEGPIPGVDRDALPDLHVPVPSGPVANW